MMPRPQRTSGGPWIYTDPAGQVYLVRQVPMERDLTLPEELRPQALVFQTEEGWFGALPVGAEFRFDQLTEEQRTRIIRFVADAGIR